MMMAKKKNDVTMVVGVDALRLAQWYLEFRETNNQTFLPLYACRSRFLVLMGGGGSGKSVFAARKVVERCATEAGLRYLVCRKVARTNRQSTFKMILQTVSDFYPDQVLRVNKSDMVITFKSGSEIIFAGLDDVEKLKSIYEINGIWIEEASEVGEADFHQLDIRMRGKTVNYKQMILSFNPISVTHWLKKYFFDRKDKRATVHHSTYLDNRFLEREDIETLETFRETDPYYYSVYALGMWGITGKTVFSGEKLQNQRNNCKPPVAVGRFDYDYDGAYLSNVRWVDDPDGEIKLYQMPEKGYPYVIGGDTAGEGSDWFVGQVIDNTTGRLVATLRQESDEDLYARNMVMLGQFFNDALISVEINFSTHPQKEMERLGYHRFYVRQVEDDATHDVRMSYGFRTGVLTRPSAIALLVQVMREHPDSVDDVTTLEEMMTFVRNDAGKACAADGAHDDTVMALAIAHYSRLQQSVQAELPPEEQVEWEDEMFEEWNEADEKTRRILEQMWGKPQYG